MGLYNGFAALVLAMVFACLVPTTVATESPRYIMYLTGYTVPTLAEELYSVGLINTL